MNLITGKYGPDDKDREPRPEINPSTGELVGGNPFPTDPPPGGSISTET